MAKSKPAGDGLEYIGKDKKSGLLKYNATLRKKSKGKLIVDTERIIYANNKADALVQKAAILAELVAHKLGFRAATSIALGAGIEEWLPTLRKGTRIAYGSHVRKLAAAVGAERDMHTISAQEIQRVIATAKVGDKTASQIRVAAIALYEWAKQSAYVKVNVAKETTKRRTRKSGAELLAEQSAKPVAKAMTLEEYERFLAALKAQDPDIHAMAGTQFFLGCRFGEVSALKWEDIDFVSGEVQVRRAQMAGDMGPPKNEKPRTAGLGPAWLAVLEQHRARVREEGRPGAEEWCFPVVPSRQRKRTDNLYGYQAVHAAFREAMKACGIEVGPATHSLRHTMITLSELARDEGYRLVQQRMAGIFGASKELQSVVGHADAKMTAHYTQVPGAAHVGFARTLERQMSKVGESVGESGGDNEAEP